MKTSHHFALAIAFQAPDIDGVMDELLASIRHISKYLDASQAERTLFKLLCDSPARYGSTIYFSVSADLELEAAQRFAELVDARAQAMDETRFIVSNGVSAVECVYAFGGPKEAVEAAMRTLRSAQVSTAPASSKEPAPAG